MKKFNLIILLCLFSISTCFSQWANLNPPNSGLDSFGWMAVSEDGKNIASYNTHLDPETFVTSYRYTTSHDFGQTWSYFNAPFGGVQDIFWENDILYVLETNDISSLKKSTDFGATFTIQNSDYLPTGKVVRANNGVWYNYFAGSITSLCSSVDQGATWTPGVLQGSVTFKDFIYANNNNLVVSCSGGIIYSSDNGSSWNVAVINGETASFITHGQLSKMSNGNLICKSNDNILLSNDHGVNWTMVNTSNLPLSPVAYMCSGMDIICLSSNGSTSKSTDGGLTFNSLTPLNGVLSLGSCMARSDADVYIGGTTTIYKYIDGPNYLEATDKKSVELVVYPNPANDQVTIRTDFPEEGQICIYSMDGKCLSNTSFNGIQATISISDLAQGVYLLSYQNDQKTITRTVVKK